jgi:hypothetical protein
LNTQKGKIIKGKIIKPACRLQKFKWPQKGTKRHKKKKTFRAEQWGFEPQVTRPVFFMILPSMILHSCFSSFLFRVFSRLFVAILFFPIPGLSRFGLRIIAIFANLNPRAFDSLERSLCRTD